MLDCLNELVSAEVSEVADEKPWHRRFCHVEMSNLRNNVSKNLVNDMEMDITPDSNVCGNCCEDKIHRNPFLPNLSSQKWEFLELVHSDVSGKMKPASSEEMSIYTFIDVSSEYCWVYFLEKKSDRFEIVMNWKLFVEKQYSLRLFVLTTVETMSIVFQNCCKVKVRSNIIII